LQLLRNLYIKKRFIIYKGMKKEGTFGDQNLYSQSGTLPCRCKKHQ